MAKKNIINIDDNQLQDVMEKKDLRDERLYNYNDKYVILLRN
jgi:hypothetical protein